MYFQHTVESCLIRTANARKNHANYPSMRIIRAYFTLHSYERQRVVSRASMRIKWGVRISEGQIIQAILCSGAHLIRTANVRKNRVNYPSMQII